MIRRLNKHSDLKDLIKSCPSGVIDDIYAIEYYIQGYNTVIQANFTKKETMLEVIIPSTDLETLPNGILMRRAYYKVLDTSYPDGYYNLEFEDNMNVWIGENESEEPVIPEYVTEDSLSSTLSSYATQDWVSSQQFLTSENLPSDLATQSWVYGRGYVTESFVSGQIGSVKNWVVSQSFLTSASLSNYITESTIESLGFATESWVQGQGYLTEHQDLSSYATQSWVQSQGYITIGEIPSGLATQSWVQSQGYLTSVPSEYATKSWVSSQQFATKQMIEDLDATFNYRTLELEAHVSALDGALSSADGHIAALENHYVALSSYCVSLSSYVDEFVSEFSSASYATQSWVQDQGYVSTTDLSSYATKSWVSSNYFEESKIWTGTQAQWNTLTATQKAGYTIALITQ